LGNFLTGTFTFDADNNFVDYYSGTLTGISNGLRYTSLSEKGKKQFITYTLGQWYQCPPGTTLMGTSLMFGWYPGRGVPFNFGIQSEVTYNRP
jgi:hypothetical protein